MSWCCSRRTAQRAKQIADEVGSIVLARDGCEGQHLAEAGANRAAIVAAVTGDDEDNLVVCQMAKHHFDVPRTIARVNNPRNEELFRHLGVDEIISPTRMALAAIEQDIPVHELLHLAQLEGGELELLEAQIGDESPAIGRKPGGHRAARWLLPVRAHPGRAGAAHPPGDDLPVGRQGAGHHAHRVRGATSIASSSAPSRAPEPPQSGAGIVRRAAGPSSGAAWSASDRFVPHRGRTGRHANVSAYRSTAPPGLVRGANPEAPPWLTQVEQ